VSAFFFPAPAVLSINKSGDCRMEKIKGSAAKSFLVANPNLNLNLNPNPGLREIKITIKSNQYQ
jgi:hypothetical protein